MSLGALHLTKHTGAKHTATIIFFHGSGGTGDNMKEWVNLMVKNFSFSHVKVLFPTAPLQPYTPAGGEMSNVWFDRKDISPNVPEDLESLNKIEVAIKELVKKENDAGIPNDRIVVGGFSMGGALALHTAYRWARDVAGAFAFSSFLNHKSVVYEDLHNFNGRLPPLLQVHGDSDELVDMKWGQETFSQLQKCGVQGEFQLLPRLGHSINKRGMVLFKQWAEELLVDTADSGVSQS